MYNFPLIAGVYFGECYISYTSSRRLISFAVKARRNDSTVDYFPIFMISSRNPRDVTFTFLDSSRSVRLIRSPARPHVRSAAFVHSKPNHLIVVHVLTIIPIGLYQQSPLQALRYRHLPSTLFVHVLDTGNTKSLARRFHFHNLPKSLCTYSTTIDAT